MSRVCRWKKSVGVAWCVGVGLALLVSTGCRTSYVMVAGSGGGVHLGPLDIELRGHGRRLPCFTHNGQFYVVGRRGMPYSIWIRNRTSERLEVLVAVDGRDVVSGRPADARQRGYVLNPYRHVNITGYRTSMRSVAAFRFSSIHRSYSSRMGSSWHRVGSIRVSVFTERGRRVYRPLVQSDRRRRWRRPSIMRKHSYGRAPAWRHRSKASSPRVTAKRRTYARRPTRRMAPRYETRSAPSAAPRSRSFSSGSVGSMDRNDSMVRRRSRSGSHGYHYPAPREGLGTAFGERRHAPAHYTRFVRASSRPTYTLKLLYNNCAGYRYMGLCTPWCPCQPTRLSMVAPRVSPAEFAPAP